MPTYRAPVQDTFFVLKDVLGYERYSNLPGFADAPLDVLEAILVGSARHDDDLMPAEEFDIYRGVLRELYRRLEDMQAWYE